MRLLAGSIFSIAISGCAQAPPFEYGNTYDYEDRAILAFPKETESELGLFTSLNRRKFADPPPTVFAKPVNTRIGYYCTSLKAERFVTLDLRPTMLYAFTCANDGHTEVECGLCKQ
jgi:hypothetical protein